MRQTVKTLLTAEQALARAEAFFGPGGKGLVVTSQRKRALSLEGGGGRVTLTAKSDSPTLLEIETRVWEDAVRQFIDQLPQERSWWARLWRRSPSPTS
jgi:hypothetical protein